MKKIQYAVIGCGGRISGLIKHFTNKKDLQLKGGWDPSSANVQQMLKKINDGKGIAYTSYEELVADPEIDWVLVGSPNAFHKEHIIAAFENNKHVFSEKPLAITIEDCIAINKSHQKSSKLFATGFTLRYASIYRKAKEILTSGKLGKVISINACENILPDHGSYIMKNWRRRRELAGPHILEKCVHDLDLINWFTESIPKKIAAFGGNNMFIPENENLYIENRELFTSTWESLAESYDLDENNPFLSHKTIEDNVVSIMEFNNGVRVQFQATMSNTIPERRMYFHCSGGTLIIELYSGVLQYKAITDEAIQMMTLIGGGHGDGDFNIMNELHDSMVNGTVPVCGGEEGLLSAVVGITIDKARENGTVIDLSEIWNSLGVKI
ncbi:MAG: Gfo/Idh/MocA family oxidoreductase [Spirochaetales bacterium]|nr:Gfo/Idh/MocA family oxidoreductase [Spirochaetales bacterium]